MTTESVLDDAGYDFDDLTDDTVSEAPAGRSPGTSRASSAATTGQRRGRRPVKRLENLQKTLSAQMYTLGTLASLPFPVTGVYVCQESHATTAAIVELAAKRPEWIDALERLADIQPGLVVGRTCLGIGAALAVDRGRAEADTKFMQFVGVYSAWRAIEDKKPLGEGLESGTRYKPPPVRFTSVS